MRRQLGTAVILGVGRTTLARPERSVIAKRVDDSFRPFADGHRTEQRTLRRRAECQLRHLDQRMRWSSTPPYNCAVRGGHAFRVTAFSLGVGRATLARPKRTLRLATRNFPSRPASRHHGLLRAKTSLKAVTKFSLVGLNNFLSGTQSSVETRCA